MSRWTFLMIALGGVAICAEAWKLKDGSEFVPVIVHYRDDGRPLLLISWDDLRLPKDEAEAHAKRCIETVRSEAKKQGL